MSVETYKTKLEAYIRKKDSSTKDLEAAKGLLAPKNGLQKEAKQQLDAIASVGEFVYAIRQKRKEIMKARGKKNGS